MAGGKASSGLLLAMMDIPAEVEADFNHWYDTEHIPERLAVPGFRGARRYKAVEGGPAYQALYELDSLDVLDTAEYKRLATINSEGTRRIVPQFQNMFRGVYREIATEVPETAAPEKVGAVLLVGLSVPVEHEEEFNAWYNTEHLPYLAAVPGVLRARRFEPTDGSKKYLAVYELTEPNIPNTDAWAKASNTPWSARQRTYYDRWLRTISQALAPVTA
jgi:hypothetical protein